MRKFPRQRTAFCSPFLSDQQVRILVQKYRARDARQPITDAQILIAGENLMRGIDLRSNLRLIYQWKLESFLRRFQWAQEFPDGVSDDMLIKAVAAARIANPSDISSVRIALTAFTTIRYVGVPVASAFLTAMHPKSFTVIDRQAYKSLGAKFRDGISEYLDYLSFCHAEAARLAVELREHDQALWQYGADLGRGRSGH
jgi:hypothetical protein